ncbi:MAG TPA: DUF72 domain-containing protein [Thermoanaerobaculia bacterium]|nr:DUF72 domain-containing protein [Thermoanaerobaculia bacterium]
MRIFVGTSGYSYKEWKGTFYPDDLPAKAMLRYYAERFRTVEINNTFYRMPSRNTFEQWLTEVGDDFRFVIKAPQRITHQKRLKETVDDVRYLFDTAAALGPHLGPILFQLPPYSRKDIETLRRFIAELPEGRVAFEFRHDSWRDDEVEEALRERDAALCISDTDESDREAAIRSTASWGYMRLRRANYDDEMLRSWARKIQSQPWSEAWVFFKHEDEGKGPEFANRFLAHLPEREKELRR